MAKTLTMTELTKMQEGDLLKEIAEQRKTLAKLHHGVRSGSEKGSHLLQSAKKHLARLLTVLSSLQKNRSAPTIPAPSR